MIEALFFSEIIVFIFIVLIIFTHGGIKQHLALLYVAFVLFIFLFFSPLYGYIHEIKILFNNNIWNYYPEIMLYYLLALISFLSGYLIIKKNKSSSTLKSTNAENNNLNIVFLRLGFIVAIGGFALWGITSGKSLTNIFLLSFFGLTDITHSLYLTKGNNYLKLLLEMLTPLLALAYMSNMKKKEFLLWLIITIIIYLSQGFRFRFIILISVFMFIYIYNSKKFTSKKIFYSFVLVLIFMYGVMQISQYRSSIKATVKGYSMEHSNQDKGMGRMIYRSTRNYLAFGSLIKYFDRHEVAYGYGDTMFKQIFVRLIPSSFFENGVKPPPRGNVISANSWGDNEALYAGEAYGAVGGAYYELGTLGVILFFLVLGIITKILDIKISSCQNSIKLILYLVTVASLFKVLTRGYLPEFFFMYLYFILPFIYIKVFYPRLWKNNNSGIKHV